MALSQECESNLSIEIASISAYSLIESVQILICVVALYEVRQLHKSITFPTLMLLSKWLFYLSSIAFSICRVVATIAYCFSPKYYTIPRNLLNVAYTVHWVGVLLIYFGRLKLVFNDTSHKVSSRTIHCFSITFIILFVLSIASIIGLYLGYAYFNIIAGLIVIAAVILSQVLAWTFVGKLKAIQHDVGMDNIAQRDKLTNTVKKYSVLSVTSVTGSSVTALSILISLGTMREEDEYMVSTIIGLIAVMDVFVDSLCMTLSLYTNDKYFRKLCCICIKGEPDKILEKMKSISNRSPRSTISPSIAEMTTSTTDKALQNIINDVEFDA